MTCSRCFYRDILAKLTEKYGEPEDTYDVYVSPFERGDGHELLAIKRRKRHLRADWKEAVDGSSIYCQVMSTLSVDAFYYSSRYSDYIAGVKAAEDDDL